MLHHWVMRFQKFGLRIAKYNNSIMGVSLLYYDYYWIVNFRMTFWWEKSFRPDAFEWTKHFEILRIVHCIRSCDVCANATFERLESYHCMEHIVAIRTSEKNAEFPKMVRWWQNMKEINWSEIMRCQNIHIDTRTTALDIVQTSTISCNPCYILFNARLIVSSSVHWALLLFYHRALVSLSMPRLMWSMCRECESIGCSDFARESCIPNITHSIR